MCNITFALLFRTLAGFGYFSFSDQLAFFLITSVKAFSQQIWNEKAKKIANVWSLHTKSENKKCQIERNQIHAFTVEGTTQTHLLAALIEFLTTFYLKFTNLKIVFIIVCKSISVNTMRL